MTLLSFFLLLLEINTTGKQTWRCDMAQKQSQLLVVVRKRGVRKRVVRKRAKREREAPEILPLARFLFDR